VRACIYNQLDSDSTYSMNTSPRKHRATFRPVDTLSSAQKPSFQTAAAKRATEVDAENENSFLEETSITYLGDSSSLFEGDSFSDSPQYAPNLPRLTSHCA
jgi:hypothetical protein